MNQWSQPSLQLVRNASRPKLELILRFQRLEKRDGIAHRAPRRLTARLAHQSGTDAPVEITVRVSGETLDHPILLHETFGKGHAPPAPQQLKRDPERRGAAPAEQRQRLNPKLAPRLRLAPARLRDRLHACIPKHLLQPRCRTETSRHRCPPRTASRPPQTAARPHPGPP